MISFKVSASKFNENWWTTSKKEITDILSQDNQLAWSEQKDPQTNASWAPLSPGYKSWKDRSYPGQPILRLTGKMQDNTKFKPGNSIGLVNATMGADYGRYHMTGTARMPARPWLGVPLASIPRIEVAIAKAISRGPIRRF